MCIRDSYILVGLLDYLFLEQRVQAGLVAVPDDCLLYTSDAADDLTRVGLGGRRFFQAEDGIRDLVRSRGLGDVYKRQLYTRRSARLSLPRTAGTGRAGRCPR